MASKTGLLYLVLVLRVFTLLFLAASIVVLATDKVHLDHDTKIYFTDVLAYRYLVAVAGVGVVYNLIQLPFAMYFAASGKRWIKTGCLPEFDFYGDKAISLLLASGVGVGFGVSVDAKRAMKKEFASLNQELAQFNIPGLDDYEAKKYKFVDVALIASGIFLGGFVTMTITSLITSIKRSEKGFK